VLRCDVASIQAVIDTLSRHNINVTKAINQFPQLLRIPPEVLDARIQFLKGLTGKPKLPNCIAVSLLTCLPLTLQNKISMFSSLGLDVKAMLRLHPSVFTQSEQAVHRRMSFFREIGMDPIPIINAKPQVVGYHVERKLRATVEYITNIMGRSLEAIAKCPRCFSASLESRLKPRHEYLKLHGKRHYYSLSTICATTDARFVLLTNSSLEQYHQWLASRTQ
jgi:hypothetical protein